MPQVGDFVYKKTKFEKIKKPNGRKVADMVFFTSRLVEFIHIKTRVKYAAIASTHGHGGDFTLSPMYNSDGSLMLATPEEIEEYRESY